MAYRLLRAISAAPAWFVQAPAVSVNGKDIPSSESMLSEADQRVAADVFRSVSTDLGRDMGFTPVFQLVETLATPIETKAIYSAQTAERPHDRWHVTSAYAELVWNELLARIIAAAEATPAKA